MCIIFVENNEEIIVERFGKFHRKLTGGVHFLLPFVEKLRGLQDPANPKKYINNGKIKTTEEIFYFPKDNRIFFAKDKSELQMKANVVYKIEDSYKAVYEVDYLFDAINQLCAGIIQSRLLDAPEDVNQIDYLQKLTQNVIETANEYSQKWGVKILKFELKQITDTNGVRQNF